MYGRTLKLIIVRPHTRKPGLWNVVNIYGDSLKGEVVGRPKETLETAVKFAERWRGRSSTVPIEIKFRRIDIGEPQFQFSSNLMSHLISMGFWKK